MKILFAEDSGIIRAGISAVLATLGHEVETVADAPSLRRRATERLTSADAPDLILTDVRMPPGHGDDGLAAAVALRTTFPATSIFVLSQYIAAAYARELLAAPRGEGAGIGYLLKDRVGRVSDFDRSLRIVAGGGIVVDPEVIDLLAAPDERDPGLAALTPREREVLGHMATGTSNAEIGGLLVVSDAAVSKHIGNIYAKLGLASDDGHRRVRAVLRHLGAD